MTETAEIPRGGGCQEDSLEDLSKTATGEFHRLLEADTSLLSLWKEAAMTLSSGGTPNDLEPLQKLLEIETDDTPKETKS